MKWNFPFEVEYWKSKKNLFSRTNSCRSSSDEDKDKDELIVEIRSLVKYFPSTNRFGVNNVSFDLYENEITALLGHNGAGFSSNRTKSLNNS